MKHSEIVSIYLGDKLLCTKKVAIPRTTDGQKILLEIKPGAFIKCDSGSFVVTVND